MTLLQYEAFVKVAEYHSISRAASEMGYTQSAVSKMLKELESDWGIRVLLRNHDGVELTAAGKALLEEARHVIRDAESLNSLVSSLHGVSSGTVRLGAPVSISANFLPKILKEFHTDHPNVRVELYEGEDVEISEFLRRGVVDVCILQKPYSDRYLSEELITDSFVAVLPKDHPMAGRDVFRVEDFATEEVIWFREVRDADARTFFSENKVTPNIVYEVSDDYIMMSMVESGLGICMDYELVLKPLRYDVAVLPMDRTRYRTLELCVRDEEAKTPLVSLLMDCIRRGAGRYNRS